MAGAWRWSGDGTNGRVLPLSADHRFARTKGELTSWVMDGDSLLPQTRSRPRSRGRWWIWFTSEAEAKGATALSTAPLSLLCDLCAWGS